jgi:predicted acetyltransferase
VNLYLALLVCQAHGIKEVLLDCDAANAGSYRTMEALGGTLVREYYDDEEDFCMTRIYTIDVDRAVETGRDVYVPQISFPFRREK